ncbi:MAG: hypothetical protein HKN50_13590 [Gammaproteobacteria bacterium]|nr:hypothetical protein [Gammaproteobacteria bacterium]
MNIDGPTKCRLTQEEGEYFLSFEGSDDRVLISPAQVNAMKSLQRPARLRILLTMLLSASVLLLIVTFSSGGTVL